jgi:hypothetical protein
MFLRAVWGMLALWLLTGSVRGDEVGEAEARRLFQQGRDAFERHAYQRAYDAFRESYVISQRPELLFNMSSALKELGRAHDAADELRAYLRVVPTAADRAQIEQRILTLEETQRILDRDRGNAPPPVAARPAPASTSPASESPQQQQQLAPTSPAPSATLTRKDTKHKRWWIGVTVAGVVVAGAVVVGLTVGLVPNDATPPSTPGGTQRALFQ